MSRTYRKRKENSKCHNDEDWILRESGWGTSWIEDHDYDRIEVKCHNYYLKTYIVIRINPSSKEGKRRLAKFHSDTGTHNFKEPGPSWFKNLTTIRPYRRKYKEQCRKFLYDTEYEVILEKMVYEYWT